MTAIVSYASSKTRNPLEYETIKHYSHSAVRYFRRLLGQGDLVSQITRVALDLIIFTSKLVKGAFDLVGRISMILLSYTGILGLHYYIQDDLKVIRDLVISLKERDFLGALHSTVKVFYKVVDTGLLIGNFTACFIALGGYSLLAKQIFLAMRPIGLASFCACFGNQIVDFWTNRCQIKRLDKLLNTPAQEKANLIAVRHFAQLLNPHWTSSTKVDVHSPDCQRARLWLRQLEIDAVQSFVDELKKLEYEVSDPLAAIDEDRARTLLSGIRKSLHNSQSIRSSNWALYILGYIALMFGRLYPDSAIQWGSTSLIAILYLGEALIKKCQDKLLRRHIRLKPN